MSVFSDPDRLRDVLSDLGHTQVISELTSLSSRSSKRSSIPAFHVPCSSFLSAINSLATERSLRAFTQDFPTDEYIADLKRWYAERSSTQTRFPSLAGSQATRHLRYPEYLDLRTKSPESLQPLLTSKLYVELCAGSLIQCPFDNLIQYLQILGDCVAHFAALLKFDPLRTGLISEANFIAYIREKAASLPFLSDGGDYLEKYIIFVSQRIGVVVDPLRSGRIPLRTLMNEAIMVNWITLKSSRDDPRRPLLSSETFEAIARNFKEMDSDKDGFIVADDLAKLNDYQLLPSFCARVCEVMSDEGKLDFARFVRFQMAWGNVGETWANTVLFDILDIDENGLITMHELHYFYREMVAIFRERLPNEQRAPMVEAYMSEAYDSCLATEEGITKENFVRSGKVGAIVQHMTDLRYFLKTEYAVDI
jgi:Ca2+-binding EF-hand superfamily protein